MSELTFTAKKVNIDGKDVPVLRYTDITIYNCIVTSAIVTTHPIAGRPVIQIGTSFYTLDRVISQDNVLFAVLYKDTDPNNKDILVYIHDSHPDSVYYNNLIESA